MDASGNVVGMACSAGPPIVKADEKTDEVGMAFDDIAVASAGPPIVKADEKTDEVGVTAGPPIVTADEKTEEVGIAVDEDLDWRAATGEGAWGVGVGEEVMVVS